MLLKTIITRFRNRSHVERFAIVLWAVFIGVGLGQAIVAPRQHSVYPIISDAARKWVRGEMLYSRIERADGLDLYRYSPAVAMLFAPLAATSDRIGGTLWRIISAGSLLVSLYWWSRSVLQIASPRSRAWLFLMVAPLAASSLHNGQSNPIVLAGMLAMMTAALHERWNLAAVCIAVSFLFKIYPISLGMLLALVYPRKLAWRVALAASIGLALPFLFKSYAYASWQYSEWITYVRGDTRARISVMREYRSFAYLFTRWRGSRLEHSTIQQVQLATALFAAGAVAAGRILRLDRPALFDLVLAMGSIWMTLFGPATEAQTYLLLAPTMAWGVMRAWSEPGRLWARFFTGLGMALLISDQLSQLFPHGDLYRNRGTLPLGAICVLLGWIPLAFSNRRQAQADRAIDAGLESPGLNVSRPHALDRDRARVTAS